MATSAFLLSSFLPAVGLGGFAGFLTGAVPSVQLGFQVIGLMKSLGSRDGLSPDELAHLEYLESNPSAAQRFLLDDWS